MLSERELSTPGSPAAQRWITRFGWGLAVVWAVCAAVIVARPRQGAGPYSLGGPSGFLPLQLASYSFLHYSFLFLAGDLLWLAAIVRLSRRCLGFDGFVRLYSVGVIGGGLACLWIFRALGAADSLWWVHGGFPSFAAMLAALAVLHPREKVFLWGERGGRWVLGAVCLLRAWPILEDLVSFHAFSVQLAWYQVLGTIQVAILATRSLTIRAIVLIGVAFAAIHLLSPTVFFGFGLNASNASWQLSYAAGVATGLIYGAFERLWARHLARTAR